MILHGLRIENWRNIGRLELADLDHPLVVLHGPNRTGKSSLFAALRGCLFDFDHDTTKVRDDSPWQNKGVPEVAVEFEQQGVAYRLTKRFSRNKDGFALLERRSSETQWTVVEREKEAGREARRILGVEKSEAGLNQLLWLNQGDTQLPEHNKLSDTLQKRLQEVLGSLLTGRDWDFYRALEKAAEVYFTPKGEIKKASPVRDLEAQFEICRKRLDELQHRSAQGNQLLLEHEMASAEIVEERVRVQETQAEVDALAQERDASRARRAEHSAARAELDNARSALEALGRKAADIAQIRQRIEALRDQLAKAELAHDHFVEQHAQYRQDAEASQSALAASRRAAEQLEEQRTGLDDLRRLSEIAAALRELTTNLAELEAIESQIAPLDRELSTLAVPSEADLKKWRKNRSEAQKLRAELDAAALRVSIEPTSAGAVNVEIDGSDAHAVPMEPGAAREWSLRQRAAVQITGFGTIRFQRGRENFDLEQAARQLADLERQYRLMPIGAYGVDPAQEQAIELLADRGRRQASLAERLQSLQTSARKLAPSGRGALLAQQSALEQERQQVAAPASDWADLQPTREAFDLRRDEFQTRAAQCQAELKRAEAAAAGATRLEREADQQRQQAQLELTRIGTSQTNLRQELERAGDEVSLLQQKVSAETRVREAEQRVAASELSEAELTVDDRLEAAREALGRREQRLNDLRTRCSRLEGELASMAGLHEELAGAEADLAVVRTQFEERQLDAEAHKLLKELFENCRDQQVQRTTGLIGEHVLGAARQLGLAEYHSIDFGTGYLPQGFHRADATGPVALDVESHGTAEQLALLVRLAVGGILAKGERHVAVLDDPLTHADRGKHRRMLELLEAASRGQSPQGGADGLGALQIVILTCHPERFDHLRGVRQIDLASLIQRP